jgi:hypothetical protein
MALLGLNLLTIWDQKKSLEAWKVKAGRTGRPGRQVKTVRTIFFIVQYTVQCSAGRRVREASAGGLT